MALVERLPTSSSEGRLDSVESRSPLSPAEVGPAPTDPTRRALDRAAVFNLMKNMARHPFAPILGKVTGIVLLLLGLSAIGAYATLKGTKARAVKLTGHTAASLAAPAGEWLMTETADPPAANSAPSPPPIDLQTEAPPSRSVGLTSDGKVILNLASVDDLCRLPGIGQKRAEAIFELRQKLGKFRRVSDILRVRGLGSKRLKNLLPHLVLDPPLENSNNVQPGSSAETSRESKERQPPPPASARPAAESPDDAA